MTSELDDAYALPPGVAERYRDHGFVHLEDVLAPATLERYGAAISAGVARLNTLDLPMDERDTYEKAFLQVMNLWTHDETVRRFVFGRRLARIAAELMGVAGVRLYHDQALYKEPGGGHTPWHADQYYWPLASDRCCTAWVPLQETPLRDGAARVRGRQPPASSSGASWRSRTRARREIARGTGARAAADGRGALRARRRELPLGLDVPPGRGEPHRRACAR